MISEKKDVGLRILKADNGKIIVSKNKIQIDEKGTMDYAIRAKKVYLGKNDDEKNYIEIEEGI